MKRFREACRAFVAALKASEKSPCKKEEKNPSHLQLLALLQSRSRLIDFLKEDLSAFDDAQVGAAVRKIHEECNRCLEEYVQLRPLLAEKEGAQIHVPEGYSVHEIKVVGKVKGYPPYQGFLRHRGWLAEKINLSSQEIEKERFVVQPAEVEVKG